MLQIPLPRSELPKNFSATRVSLRERQRQRGKQQRQQQQQGAEGGSEGRGEGEGEKLVEKKSSQIHPIVSQTDAGGGPEIEGASTIYFLGTEVRKLTIADTAWRKRISLVEFETKYWKGNLKKIHKTYCRKDKLG